MSNRAMKELTETREVCEPLLGGAVGRLIGAVEGLAPLGGVAVGGRIRPAPTNALRRDDSYVCIRASKCLQ